METAKCYTKSMDNSKALPKREDKLAFLAARFADEIARDIDISRAEAFRAALQEDGSWPDIDYSDKTRSCKCLCSADRHINILLSCLGV